MYIGKVAALTGATPRAIRLYESQGLIPPPVRQGRYRIYSDTEVKAIALVKRAQEADFTLAELRSFINTKVQENRFPLELARVLILRKRIHLDEEMQALKLTQLKLETLEQEIETRYA